MEEREKMAIENGYGYKVELLRPVWKKEIEKLEKTWKKWKKEAITNAIDVKKVKDTDEDIEKVLRYITVARKKRIMKLDDMEIRAFFEMINDRKRLFTTSGIFK